MPVIVFEKIPLIRVRMAMLEVSNTCKNTNNDRNAKANNLDNSYEGNN